MTRMKHGSDEDSNIWTGDASHDTDRNVVGCRVSDHLVDPLRDLRAELAALKREHAQLRAAAKDALEESGYSCVMSSDKGAGVSEETLSRLSAALDATPAEPVRKFTMGAVAKPESPVQVGYVVPSPCASYQECGQRVLDPHGDMKRSVCQRCEHQDEPVRETFDPEAVRDFAELIDAWGFSDNGYRLEVCAELERAWRRVMDSEHK